MFVRALERQHEAGHSASVSGNCGQGITPTSFRRLVTGVLCIVVRAVALMAGLAGTQSFALNRLDHPGNYIARHWDTEAGLPHNAVKQIFQTRDGYLWVGTQQGLARFDGLAFTVFNQNNTPAFPSNLITSLAETSDGSLWIATSLGLVRYHNGRFTTFRPADGLKADTVNALCVVPDGSLWIGTRNGVSRWVDGKIVNDIDTSGFDTVALRYISVDRQGGIWLTIGFGALRYEAGKFTPFDSKNGLPRRSVQRIQTGAEGRILAVTQQGLHQMEGDKFVLFEENSALASQRLSTTLVDRDGNLWIGSIGGLDRYVDGKLVQYVDRYGNKLGVVDALFEDREGCLWVGTSEGIYRFTDRRGQSWGAQEGVTGTLGLAVNQMRDGSIWVSMWGNGVARLHQGQVTNFVLGAPLSHETITAIYEAPDGSIWLGNRGSSVDRWLEGKITTFVYKPGVPTSRPVTAIHGTPDGELYFGVSRRGLLRLHNNEIVPVPEAATVAEETVWAFHRTTDGRFLMGTSKGLFERTAAGQWLPLAPPGLPSLLVARAFLDDADTLWIATDGLGLVRWRDGHARAYTTREGMVDDTIFSVLADGHGALWVSSARGIVRIQKTELDEIDRGAITHLNAMKFGRNDGLLSGSTAGNGFPAAQLLTDGRVITATDKGIAVIDPKSLQTNNQPPTVAIEQVVVGEHPIPLGSALSIPAGVNRLEIRYTALSLVAPQRLRFRYQLIGSDPSWVEAGHERSARYTHLKPGHYAFRVLACNNDGVWNNDGAQIAFTIEPRIYQTLWFRIAALVGLAAAIAAFFRLRMRQINQRQQALARANSELDQRVKERTAEVSRSHAELQQRETLFRLIFEHAPVGICWKRTDLGATHHFNSTCRRILDLPADALSAESPLATLVHPEDAPRQAEMEQRIRSGETDSYTIEQRFVRRDGREVWALFAAAVIRDAEGKIQQTIGILEDVTARKHAEQELTDTYKRLMEASRVAGMAEVATGVLHNVGNVLNSVNVSATLISDGLNHSRVGHVAKMSALLHQNAGNLAAYLTEDPKGQRILPFLDTLADQLAGERQRLIEEARSLRDNVEHIKEIVARQQSYAQLGGLLEKLSPSELMEDTLRMTSVSLSRHGIAVVREFSPTPPVMAERHKVLQILINLVQNAEHALKTSTQAEKRLCLRIVCDEMRVRFVVSDNGVGISAENLAKIFQHGFTTRKNGHGFGLHSAALAAKEMKGRLSVLSNGSDCGATFLLELPAVIAETSNTSPPFAVPV